MGPHTRGMGGKVRKFFSEETNVDVDVDVDGVEEADVAETGDGDGDEAGVVVDGDDVNCDAVGVRE